LRYITLATGGHVDHGKTSLIKALTSIDTDRLPEEKQRGMSIDVGFAFVDLQKINTRVEIIDVPGHERFLKNAIAGLSSAQGLILVVDANEGLMPQTVEHLKLAKSFGIEHCIVAITKIDRADPELIKLVKEDVEEFLRKENVKCFGFYLVSSKEGIGFDELKEGIAHYVESLPEPPKDAFFRMSVDSAFHIRGYGTVLRGSCMSGIVKEGDTLILEPLGIQAKVRNIQNHGNFVKEGKAWQRLAINLPEIDHKLVERGFWLVKRGELLKTKITLISAYGIKPGKEYTFFFGMRGVSGIPRHIHEDVYMIRLSQPVVCVRSDRGAILDSSGRFVCGYKLLDPNPKRLSKAFVKKHLHLLKEDPITYYLLESGVKGMSIKELSAYFGRAINPQHTQSVRIGDILYHPDILKQVKERLLDLIQNSKGVIKLAEVVSKLKITQGMLGYILKDLRGYTVVEGYLLDEKSAKIEELESFKKLMEFMQDGIREENDLFHFKDVLTVAVKKGYIHSLGEFLYIRDDLFKNFVEKLKELGDTFSLQQAKEKLGLTRKYLIPLLEYMDLKGLTQREGNVRKFTKDV
jgi:selenocysteine-specific elongation factor